MVFSMRVLIEQTERRLLRWSRDNGSTLRLSSLQLIPAVFCRVLDLTGHGTRLSFFNCFFANLAISKGTPCSVLVYWPPWGIGSICKVGRLRGRIKQQKSQQVQGPPSNPDCSGYGLFTLPLQFLDIKSEIFANKARCIINNHTGSFISHTCTHKILLMCLLCMHIPWGPHYVTWMHELNFDFRSGGTHHFLKI